MWPEGDSQENYGVPIRSRLRGGGGMRWGSKRENIRKWVPKPMPEREAGDGGGEMLTGFGLRFKGRV